MFNIGGPEVLVIALVALVVVGPEQLPGVLRKAGKYAAQIRSMSTGLRQEFMAGVDELDPNKWAGSNDAKSDAPKGTLANPIVPKGYAERVAAGEAGNPFKAKPVSQQMAAASPDEAAAEAEAEADKALKRAEAAREKAAQLRAEASNSASAEAAREAGQQSDTKNSDTNQDKPTEAKTSTSETAGGDPPPVKRNAIADANASQALE